MMRKFRGYLVMFLVAFLIMVGASQGLAMNVVSAQEGNVPENVFRPELVHSPAMMDAYEAFTAIEGDLVFKDLVDIESDATTREEVESLMAGDIEPATNDLVGPYSLVYYTYTSDDVIEELNNAALNADLAFMFANDELIAVGIPTTAYMMEASTQTSVEDMLSYLEEIVPVEEIQFPNRSIFSFSRILYDGEFYDAVAIPTTETGAEYMLDNLVFRQGKLIDATYFEGDDIPGSLIDSNTIELILNIAPEFVDAMAPDSSGESESEQESGTVAPPADESSEPLSSQELDAFLNEATLINEAMVQAYGDYSAIVDGSRFSDAGSTDPTASSKEEVESLMESSPDSELMEGTLGSEVVKYIYDVDGAQAGLYTYYFDDVLVYAGISNETIDESNLEPVVQGDFANVIGSDMAGKLAEANLPVLSVGTLSYDGAPITILVSPVTRENENLYEGTLILRGDQVVSQSSSPVDSYGEHDHDGMIMQAQEYLTGE